MRRLTRSKLSALLFCGLAAAPGPLAAQQGRARVTAEQPPQTEKRAQPRPAAAPLHVEPVPAEVEAVLKEWHAKTKGITKLQGEHRRWKYEPVFNVAKVATGKYYYEGPDKGRIDLEPDPESNFKDVDPKQAGVQVNGVDKNVYTLKPDTAERWICDGQRIVQIHDAEKTFEVQPIPAGQQGINIMDGPLPFLFGLPPEKAKQRYDIKLGSGQKPDTVYLVVTPKSAQDARNWQRADVMLSKQTYLPTAVMLLDPSGEGITVFSFGKPDVNPKKIFELFTGNPFKPTLLGYKQVQAPAPEAVQPLDIQGKAKGLPSFIGLSHTDAKQMLGTLGLRDNIEFRKGPVATNKELIHHVVAQSPQPGAAVKPGEKVVLTLYVTEADLTKDAKN